VRGNSITYIEEESFLRLKHKGNFQMQGDKVSNETKEDEVARFGTELTSKIRLNDIKHPGTKFQQTQVQQEGLRRVLLAILTILPLLR